MTDAVTGESCSFCGHPATETGPLASGATGVTICADCADAARQYIDDVPIATGSGELARIADLYRAHLRDPKRERQFLASLSFFATFATVRMIVRSIQSGKGPFHNVTPGGKHIHHLVWGILLLMLVGFVWLHQIGTGVLRPRKWMRATALFYGAGSALTLDEFALWLNLSDVYFTPEGRESIDAVILFGSILSVSFWGRPFLHPLAQHLFHKTTGGKFKK